MYAHGRECACKGIISCSQIEGFDTSLSDYICTSNWMHNSRAANVKSGCENVGCQQGVQGE